MNYLTESQEQKQKAEKAARDSFSHVQRNAVLEHPLAGRFRLASETSTNLTHPADNVHNTWAKGLERQWYLEDPSGREAEIRHFVYDKATKCFIYHIAKDYSYGQRW